MNRPTRICTLVTLVLVWSNAMVLQPALGGTMTDVRHTEVVGFYRIDPPAATESGEFSLLEGFVDGGSAPFPSFPVRDMHILLLGPVDDPPGFGPNRAILNLPDFFFDPFEPRFVIYDLDLNELADFRLRPPVADIVINEDGISGIFTAIVELSPLSDPSYTDLNRLDITFENWEYTGIDELESLGSSSVGGVATWPVPPGSEVSVRWRLYIAIPEPHSVTLALLGVAFVGAASLRRWRRVCHGASQS